MSDFKEILSQAKQQIKEVSPQEVREKLNPENGFTLLDVREGDEWEQGHLDKAIFLPRGFLEVKADKILTDKQKPIVVYCAGGVRSALAAKTLQDLGYSKVFSMAGGYGQWKANGFPTVVPEKIGKDQMARYSRHLLIPEVGEKGQLKLLRSKVLLVGAGGLGSPAGVYLAASGVGTIGLVDNDVVDDSNLQRQILHWTSSVGMPKVDSARRTLFEVNPDVKVRTYNLRLDASNVLDILGEYDVIISGSDNFTTAYMVNDAAVMLKKPVAYGSIFRFDGQASTFIPYEGPCFRCLYSTPTPPELAPSCDEAGVLGVLPGVVGMIQATEAIKLLLNIGTTLSGRLLTYDALDMSFRQFKLRRDPDCKTCGPNAHIDLESIPEFVCALQTTKQTRLKATQIHVGDFIYCRSKYYRDQLQLPEELGLVIEIKRSNFKVLYPNDKRCWLPRDAIARMRPDLDYGNFLEKLYYLIKKVHAHECELVSDNGVHRLSLRIDKIDHDTVNDLRNFLADGFISLTVVPEGMAFMQLELHFKA